MGLLPRRNRGAIKFPVTNDEAMTVGELMDELGKHRPEEQVVVQVHSKSVTGIVCDECGCGVPLDIEGEVMQPSRLKRLFDGNMKVFIEVA